MKRYLFFLAQLMISVPTLAQQDPLYSQYLNNPFVLNPAYAGLTDNLNLSISYRSQWTGLEGSPKTMNANGHISLLNNRAGAGLMVISDRIGNTTINEILSSYSYRIKITNEKTVSFGLQAGMVNYQIDNSKVTPWDVTDHLFQGNSSESKPSIGFGIILKSDRFFLGASVPRMLRSTLQTQGLQSTLYTQHFYFMGSYIFFLSEKIRFKPSSLIKAVSGAPLSFDLNASFIINQNYQVGLLTRNFKTAGLFMQALIKDSFRFGYVYELPINTSSSLNFSSHEVTLGFRMNMLSFHRNNGVFSF